MNKKNTLVLLFATALCLAFLIPSASAGGRWHQSGFVVVYGYPSPPFFYSNYVTAWSPYRGAFHFYRHHPPCRCYKYHRRHHPRYHRDRDHRDDSRHRHR